jgi:large subunit ribosomal protein L4
MELQVYSIDGKAVKKINVPDEIYNVEMNTAILHSVVKAYQANRRQGTHATKTKAMVSGGGKKPFKQKGTGGARQGSTRNPHMPGGGEAHGPQPRKYRQFVTRSARVTARSSSSTTSKSASTRPSTSRRCSPASRPRKPS